MANGDGLFAFFDAPTLLSPFLGNLLRRGCVVMVHAAIGIGTNLDDLSALAAVHDDGLGHLVTGFLNG